MYDDYMKKAADCLGFPEQSAANDSEERLIVTDRYCFLLFRVLLAGFYALVEPLVGHLGQLFLIFVGTGETGFFAVAKVFVSHPIVLIGTQRERIMQILQT